MAKYQLIIDNQIADVYDEKDIAVAVTYSISEVADIEKRSNPTTNTVKIPGTKRNCAIFGYPEVADVVGFKGQKNIITGSIAESGTEIIIGIVNLKNVTRNGNEIEFEITIIGNSGEWVAMMKDADLVGLDIGGTHYKTKTNIDNSLAADQSYIYPLVNFGYTGCQAIIGSVEDDGNGKAKFIIEGTNTVYGLRDNIQVGDLVYGVSFSLASYNKLHTVKSIDGGYAGISVTTETVFTGDSSGKLRVRNKSDIRVEDRPLALSLYEIFNKLFEDTGYTIESVFTETTFFKRLFILPGREKQSDTFSEEHTGSTGFNAETTFTSTFGVYPIPFDTVVSDPGTHFTIESRFVADRPMLVNFRTVLKIKQQGTEDRQTWIIYMVNGAAVYSTNRIQQYFQLGEDYQVVEQWAELRLQTGDYVETQLKCFDSGTLTVSSDETLFEANVTDAIIKGSEIIPGNHLPNIKRLDFVKAIRHLFNLYFLTDVNMKKVYIEPRDTFFSETETLDWSLKLDTSRPVIFEELGSDVNKKLVFGYMKDSNDWAVAELEKDIKKDYQTKTVLLDNQFSKEEKKILNPLFAPTLMDTFPQGGMPVSKVPKIWKEPDDADNIPEKVTEYVPRILYFKGAVDLATGESYNFEGVPETVYPLFDTFDATYSLYFSDAPRSRDMYIRYYENYIRTLNESRKITAFFNLKASDIQPFISPDDSGATIKDYRAMIYFLHRGVNIHARIESIVDYRPKQTTKVILVTDSDNLFAPTVQEEFSIEFTNVLIWGGVNNANGVIAKWGSSWNTVHGSSSGNTTMGDSYDYGIGSKLNGSTYQIERVFLYFDTSIIPTSATILEATLHIHKRDGDQQMEICVYEGSQGALLTNSDWDEFTGFQIGESLPGGLGWRVIPIDADSLAVINKDGWTKFCLREKYFDALANVPAYNYNTFKTNIGAAVVGATNKLVVKYKLA